MQLIAVTFALAMVLTAGAPGDDPVLAEAKGHVEKAKKAFAKAHYADAEKEFRAALALKPKASLWFNIAKCEEKRGDSAGAL